MHVMTRGRHGIGWWTRRLVVGGVLALGVLPSGPALGQGARTFTSASLHGRYAVVGTGGDHTAASVGIEAYDGQGHVTRDLVLNEAAPDHTRRIVAIKGRGTYQVQPDGMGTATIVNTAADGSTFTSHLDFVITEATGAVPGGDKVATRVSTILRETGVAATLVTFVLTRLPD